MLIMAAAISLGQGVSPTRPSQSVRVTKEGPSFVINTGVEERLPVGTAEPVLRRRARANRIWGNVERTAGYIGVAAGVAEMAGAVAVLAFAPYLAVPAIHAFVQGFTNATLGIVNLEFGKEDLQARDLQLQALEQISSMRRSSRTGQHNRI